MKHIYTAITLFFFAGISYGQTAPQWSINNGLVSVKSNAFISVKGDVHQEAGNIDNSETIYVTGNWTNNAPNPMSSTANNEGIVRFVGDEQTIDGSEVVNFYDLHLQETGIKHANQDVEVYGKLYLNDREFEANTHTISIKNPDIDAIQTGLNGTWGFVSNLDNGALERATNSTQDYFYPVGSALGTNRFRPINIKPQNTNASAYAVRFANTDATNESYDRSSRAWTICETNPNYYHRISQTLGNTTAMLEFFYNTGLDNVWNGLAKWENSAWAEMTTLVDNGTDATYNLQKLQTSTAISDFAPNPFILSNLAPAIDLAVGPSGVCANTLLEIEAIGNYNSFDFYIDSTLVASQSDNIYEQFSTPEGIRIIHVAGSNGTCGRSSDTLQLRVYPAFTATTGADTIVVTGTAATLYGINADFYEWTNDPLISCLSCESTVIYPTASQTFYVTMENIEGCALIDSMRVEVREDVANILFIPNVLTPNNDGKNDTWKIENIEQFPRNSVTILNRWGDKVFYSKVYNNEWNGDFGGGKLPAGTYYYVLDLGDDWGIFKGDVTIIRE